MPANHSDLDHDALEEGSDPRQTRPHVVVIFSTEVEDAELERLYNVAFNTSDDNSPEMIAALPPLLPWDQIFRQFPNDLTFSRVFMSLALEGLKDANRRANAIRKNERNPVDMPRLHAYYRFEFLPSREHPDPDTDTRPADLLRLLEDNTQRVERVYLSSEVGPPPRIPVMHEGFFNHPAYGGIGIRAIQRTYRYSKGLGIRFVDVEQGWLLKHPELPAIPRPVLISGVNHVDPAWRLHGLMVLGLLIAKDDSIGVTGIAPSARPFLASEVKGSPGSYSENTADAIIAAANVLQPGDVILIEGQQRFRTSIKINGVEPKVKINLPVEADSTIFAAIAAASALGIIVIEAAGNNAPCGIDLDTVTFNSGQAKLFTNDCGAIRVGAGSNAYNQVKFTQRVTSNHSASIECFADGDWLWVLDERTFPEGPAGEYELVSAGGTSSATAIIAGVAIVLQSIARHNGGVMLPGKMRAFLSDKATGTAPIGQNPRIGVMPNLLEMESTHGSLATLYTKWP